MQIARGGGRQSDDSPVNRSAFLDVVTDSSPSSNLVDNVLNKVAEYVEPAASKTTEIFDALNRAVAGDTPPQLPRRKSFIEALNQASTSRQSDDTLSVNDLDEVQEIKRFDFTPLDISKMLEASLTEHAEITHVVPDDTSPKLETTSTYIEPTSREVISSIFALINDMEKSIHKFGLTGNAQSLPESPRHETTKTKTEKLLNRMLNRSPIHRRSYSKEKNVTVSKESEQLISKLELQMNRLKKNRIGTTDSGGNDVLDSARVHKEVQRFMEIESKPPVAPESRRSSLGLAILPPTVVAPEVKPVPFAEKKQETTMKEVPALHADPPPVTDGGLGIPPQSPEIIEMGTEIGGQSDTSSVEDELFFANSKDTAKKERKKPWKRFEKKSVEEKPAQNRSETPHEKNIPENSRSRALSPKHYCVKCSRLLSYSPRRIRDNVLDRLLREEALRWKRCQACIERMFPSVFDPLLRRIVDKEGLISFEDGELLYELCGKAEIPIRWKHRDEKREFISVAHLVLFELSTNKDDVKKVQSSSDLNKIINTQGMQLIDDPEGRLASVIKSVCQLQVDQHPLLAHLLSKYQTIPLHVPEVLQSEFDSKWIGKNIGTCWCEIVGQMSMDTSSHSIGQSRN